MKKNKLILIVVSFLMAVGLLTPTFAQSKIPLRREISPSSPVMMVHIDTHIWPDPQKIIDLIPMDIRPYVVMNISLSAGDFVRKKYPFTIVESWLRTCAENRIWATVQPASGYFCNFSDTALDDYEYFYKYPNFLGWNFAEQNWGFPSLQDYITRLDLFTNLLKLANKYGGYLMVSNFLPLGNNSNAVGKLKMLPSFTAVCKNYNENYVVLDKLTSQSGFYDNESGNLGTYLSGYAGNYGIRFDECGWNTDINSAFPESAGGIALLEHFMLTGATITDGPELTWAQAIKNVGMATTPDGYTTKKFEAYNQFSNLSIDLFRKIIDGTIPILSKKNVIERTKIAFVNDINDGTGWETCNTEKSLFTGLYAIDGEWDNNKTWFKKTGRYPSIPMIFKSGDYETGAFDTIVLKSAYSTRWPTQQAKVNEFNKLFPSEYSGDMFVARVKNKWLTYNPYKDIDKKSGAIIPLKYNSCDSIALTYSRYDLGVITEYGDSLSVYLNNFCTDSTYGVRVDTIKVYGSINEPSYFFTDRSVHTASTFMKIWKNGIFLLVITHNGPLDLMIHCVGNTSDKLTDCVTANLITPDLPPLYSGSLQYEAENFDYKNVTSVSETSLPNYTAMGYVNFGINPSASLKDTIHVLKTGEYTIKTKYCVPSGKVIVIRRVNGVRKFVSFEETGKDIWGVNSQKINLNSGKNVIQFFPYDSSNNIYFDNIIIERNDIDTYNFNNDVPTTNAGLPELITQQSGSLGVVSFTDKNNLTSNILKAYSVGDINNTGVADFDIFSNKATDYIAIWKEYVVTSGGRKGLLLRGTGPNGSCPYAIGMKQGYLFVSQSNADGTISLLSYIADANGISMKSAYTTSFKLEPNQLIWFRAKAFGNQFSFECSTDSLNWEGASSTNFTDNSYASGSTQLVWGLGTEKLGWLMDDIRTITGNLTVSKFLMDGFEYVQGSGPSLNQSFNISGAEITDNIQINSGKYFEISLDADSEYSSSVTIKPSAQSINTTPIYVRLRSGLPIEVYCDTIVLATSDIQSSKIILNGKVTPQPTIKAYDFSSDVASTGTQTPPAINMTIGNGNTATAGVVNLTDSNGQSSKMFKPYSCGQRNTTGVVDLNLFSKTATDYSITWKEYVGSSSTGYKVGMLLRGQTANVGTASTGYTQGMKQGYLFLVFNTGTSTEFRIYKSNSLTSLNALTTTEVSTLIPNVKEPIWYRATVAGSSSVSLIFEYSTDSINWYIGTAATDNTSSTFEFGGTQIVWGLAMNNLDFYLDNIVFNGLDVTSGTLLEALFVSQSKLSGLNYELNNGPSNSHLLVVSGTPLTSELVITAPMNFEVSLDGIYYYSTLTIPIVKNSVAETNIYVRLKSGLEINSYSGKLILASLGVLNKYILLNGEVGQVTGLYNHSNSNKTVIYTEYYTISGQRVRARSCLKGLIIMREIYSDGSFFVSKFFFKDRVP